MAGTGVLREFLRVREGTCPYDHKFPAYPCGRLPVTVAEMIHQLSTIDGKTPVLAWSPEDGGYVGAGIDILGEDGPEPCVVIG